MRFVSNKITDPLLGACRGMEIFSVDGSAKKKMINKTKTKPDDARAEKRKNGNKKKSASKRRRQLRRRHRKKGAGGGDVFKHCC